MRDNWLSNRVFTSYENIVALTSRRREPLGATSNLG